jgi:hypothetical protein
MVARGHRRLCETCGIGRHARDATFAQGRAHRAVKPCGMTWLARDRPLVQLTQQVEERQHDRRLEHQARRQLQQQASQLAVQAVDFAEKGFQCWTAIAQASHVADAARHLHREPECFRHRRRPAAIGCGQVRAIERGIDFHRAENLRIARQMAVPIREFVGVFRRNRPARAADVE